MGWFAHVSNPQDPDDWAARYQEIIQSITPNSFLTIVDCHI